jgi:isopentenyl diphosphate isomerase/L-lactate dehydrogenase-like FMN-dependent dehydrogenase
MSDRKLEHIELAFKSQTTAVEADSRFIYEPLLSEHPTGLTPKGFFGKTLRTPIWACSMTGGAELAKKINENIARVCKDFGYYLMKKSTVPALYGQASAILKFAKKSYEELFKYIEMQAKGLSLSEVFLRINPDYL